MTRRLFTGGIQSSNTPGSFISDKDNSVYRCMVTDFLPIDHKNNVTKNSSNPQITYTVVILGGFKAGQLIDNVRLCTTLGGQYNFNERVLRKTSSKELNKIPLEKQDGDIVYVQFIQGVTSAPIIIGLGTAHLDKTGTGAKIVDSYRAINQYNGVYEETDKDGNFTLVKKGGQNHKDKKYFIPVDVEEYDKEFKHDAGNPKESFQAKFLLEKNKITLQDPSSIIIFEKNEKRLTQKVGAIDDSDLKKNLATEGGASLPFSYIETIDGINETKEKIFKSGMKIKEDGKNDQVTINTNGGLSIKIDGTSDSVNIVTKAGDTLDIQPGSIKIKENGGGTLNLASGKVALGNGEELLQLIDDLLTAIQATTHTGNLGVPTGVPLNNADFAAIQSKLISIKGSL